MYHWSTDGRAQRRPGHQPRRHSRSLAAREEARQRSTKAGASTPATPLFIFSECFATRDAQRRPGHQPRRHAATRVVQIVGIPAQRRPGLQPRRHSNVARYEYYDHGRAQRRPGHQPRRHVSLDLRPICLAARSTKAGASTPATPPRPRRGAQRLSALNEGRGINPGDTSGRCVSACRIRGRSTKAGASTPATQGLRLLPSANFMTAQRRPGHQPRRHLAAEGAGYPDWHAQRRPGHQPRRHTTSGTWRVTAATRSTKAGASTPATPLRCLIWLCGPRSTKAGASTPATLFLYAWVTSWK